MTSNKENIAFDFGSFVVRYGVDNVMYSIWRQCLDLQSSKVDMKHLPWSLEVASQYIMEKILSSSIPFFSILE